MQPTDIEQESQLISAAKADLQEFEKLYELYFQRVYGYFISRMGNIANAEDLTSQTFLKALESFDRYEFTGKPFGVWLFRIAHNLRVDFYRKNKAPTVELDKAQEVASNDNVEDKVHSRLLYEKIERLLCKFSSEEKEIILLKLSSGLKFSEIAQVIGKKESTIKTKYFRTLKNLKGNVNILILLIALLSS